MAYDLLQTFDIVTSPYVDLNGNVKSFSNGDVQRALFMVIAVDNGNVLACKITSQDTYHNSPDFTYTLRRESHPFLRAESYIQITKPHTLNVSSCTKVGEVANFCRPHILNQMSLFFNTLIKIAKLQVSIQAYESPNRKIHSFGGVTYKK